MQGNAIKFDFSFGGTGGVSPFGSAVAPGRYSQHVLATVDDITTDTGLNERAIEPPTWRNGAGAVYTLFSAFPCDSGLANQPPVFVTSKESYDTGVPTDLQCFIGKVCEVVVQARDFAIDQSGKENGLQTMDVVRIELAPGVSSHADSDLTHINGSACQVCVLCKWVNVHAYVHGQEGNLGMRQTCAGMTKVFA
jgi:hypothetical protein